MKRLLNILKWMLIQVGGFDLSLVMRKLIGTGEARGLLRLCPLCKPHLWRPLLSLM